MRALNDDTIIHAKNTGVQPTEVLRRHLDSVGDGTGTKNMAVVADEYFLTPPANHVYVIESLDVIVEDDGDLVLDQYGSLVAALTNGCILSVKEISGTALNLVKDFTDALPIKRNADYFRFGDVSFTIDVGDLSVLKCHIDMRTIYGMPLRLSGNNPYRLSFNVQDSLVGLVGHYVIANGADFVDMVS